MVKTKRSLCSFIVMLSIVVLLFSVSCKQEPKSNSTTLTTYRAITESDARGLSASNLVALPDPADSANQPFYIGALTGAISNFSILSDLIDYTAPGTSARSAAIEASVRIHDETLQLVDNDADDSTEMSGDVTVDHFELFVKGDTEHLVDTILGFATNGYTTPGTASASVGLSAYLKVVGVKDGATTEIPLSAYLKVEGKDVSKNAAGTFSGSVSGELKASLASVVSDPDSLGDVQVLLSIEVKPFSISIKDLVQMVDDIKAGPTDPNADMAEFIWDTVKTTVWGANASDDVLSVKVTAFGNNDQKQVYAFKPVELISMLMSI